MQDDAATCPLVLFDGVCSLCNGAVDFIIRHDQRGDIAFASLQSDVGRDAMVRTGHDPDALDTMVLVDGDGFWTRSDAALRIAGHMGGAWRVALALRIVPRFVRDAVYRVVARNRYRWFGKRESCRLPTPEEREGILG